MLSSSQTSLERAGQYRTHELSIGIDPIVVMVAVRDLIENAKFWFQDDSPSTIDHHVVRVHHQLTLIHPFHNGNGRLAREFADLLLASQGNKPFTWGMNSGKPNNATRSRYIRALKLADQGDYETLIEFVRS